MKGGTFRKNECNRTSSKGNVSPSCGSWRKPYCSHSPMCKARFWMTRSSLSSWKGCKGRHCMLRSKYRKATWWYRRFNKWQHNLSHCLQQHHRYTFLSLKWALCIIYMSSRFLSSCRLSIHCFQRKPPLHMINHNQLHHNQLHHQFLIKNPSRRAGCAHYTTDSSWWPIKVWPTRYLININWCSPSSWFISSWD